MREREWERDRSGRKRLNVWLFRGYLARYSLRAFSRAVGRETRGKNAGPAVGPLISIEQRWRRRRWRHFAFSSSRLPPTPKYIYCFENDAVFRTTKSIFVTRHMRVLYVRHRYIIQARTYTHSIVRLRCMCVYIERSTVRTRVHVYIKNSVCFIYGFFFPPNKFFIVFSFLFYSRKDSDHIPPNALHVNSPCTYSSAVCLCKTRTIVRIQFFPVKGIENATRTCRYWPKRQCCCSGDETRETSIVRYSAQMQIATNSTTMLCLMYTVWKRNGKHTVYAAYEARGNKVKLLINFWNGSDVFKHDKKIRL